MNIEIIIFFIFSALLLVSSLAVITINNPVTRRQYEED